MQVNFDPSKMQPLPSQPPCQGAVGASPSPPPIQTLPISSLAPGSGCSITSAWPDGGTKSLASSTQAFTLGGAELTGESPRVLICLDKRRQ